MEVGKEGGEEGREGRGERERKGGNYSQTPKARPLMIVLCKGYL